MRSVRRTAVVLMALLALGLAPAAGAAVDYSKNSASGDYAPAVTSAPATPASTADDGFAWADAAIGAAVALGVVLMVTVLRSGRGMMRARREPA